MLVGKNIQSPNFGTKIILSRSEYLKRPIDKLYKPRTGVGYPWTMKEAKFLEEGVSGGAEACTMGVLKAKGGKKGYLFHSTPENSFDEVKEAIIKAIKKLRPKGQEIEGFLTGGNACAKKSPVQYTKLMELLDELKVSYTAILGQKTPIVLNNSNPTVDMYMSVPKDEYVLRVNDYCKPGDISLKSTGSKDGDRAKLREYFDVAKIRDEDVLELE